MKRLIVTITVAFALATIGACGDAVVELDEDGLPTKTSIAAVQDGLTPAEQEEFRDAMMTIVAGEAFAEGIGGLLANSDATEVSMEAKLKGIEGLSASEVIRTASEMEAERAERRQREKAERERREAEDAREKAAAMEAYLDRLAANVEFAASDFRVDDIGGDFMSLRSRNVDLTLTNKGDGAIAGITFSAEVRTPGRSVPWAEDDGIQAWFTGGVESGETATKEYTFNGFGAFSHRKTFKDGSVFTATIECVYGPVDAEDVRHPMYEPPDGVCGRIRRL